MMMRWEKLQIESRHGEGEEGGRIYGPGRRWGHTCNAIAGGKLLYVFGGYGKDNCQTNQVHVFDPERRAWSEPVMKGTLPVPRDSHSCTNVGDNLFVFGGTDGTKPLNDLHILDTSSNTWISPTLRGEGPEAREGHSAALIGKRLFIFGGCGKSSNNSNEEHYDDLYILNTETFVWKRAATSGTPPTRRDSHTCSSWKNKIIVIGGEDSFDYYLSDVHILDADTLIWRKLNTMGQLLPPRGGHTTVALGKNLFVFGGFTDEQNLYNDIYMLDIDTAIWTKVTATGEGPSSRFSMAGDSLDPEKGGVLVFIGGCNKNLEALDDIYYLYTGLGSSNDRDDRRLEKLSLRKQLKLKCQEQQNLAPAYEKALVSVEPEANPYQPMHGPTYIQSNRQRVYLNEYQPPLGKRTFQAKVTKNLKDGYTIETIIDGKSLRGVLFSNKPRFNNTSDDDCNRTMSAEEIGGAELNDNFKSKSEVAIPIRQNKEDDREPDDVHAKKAEVAPVNMKNPESMPLDASQVPGNSKLPVATDVNPVKNETKDTSNSMSEIHSESVPVASKESITLFANQGDKGLATEEQKNP